MRFLRYTCFLVLFLFFLETPYVRASEGSEGVNSVDFFSEFKPFISGFRLENGLRVVVFPDHRVPVVTHMMWLRAGAVDEPVGLSGIAHYLEHLMFKDGGVSSSDGYSEVVRRNGGEDNAFTSQDHTAYYFRVSSDRLDKIMGLESARLLSFNASETQALSELDVILEERRLRLENSGEARFLSKLRSFLWTDHPYGIPIIGHMEDIAGLTLSDARDFHSRFYLADNMVLVLAGDVTVSRARALAEKHYGSLVSSGRVFSSARVVPAFEDSKRVVYRDSRASNAILHRSYRVPSYSSATSGEGEILDILSYILGGNSVSRLYQDFVVGDRVASSVYSYYNGDLIDGGVFSVQVIPLPDSDVYDYDVLRDGVSGLEDRIDSALRRIAVEGVSAVELSDAKRSMISDYVYAFDNQARVARLLGHNVSSGFTVSDILDWPSRINAVRGEDIRLAALSLLDKPSVTGWLVPLSGSSADGISEDGAGGYEGQL